jgi:hypothetical protein
MALVHLGTRPRRSVGLLAAGLGLFVAGCSSTPASSSDSPSALSSSRHPLPAGRTPSEIAKMVCAREAQKEIAETLGVHASVSKPTWTGHAYSCRFEYRDGAFVLTVKELSSWPQTYSYFATLARKEGRTKTVPNVGQGAFQTDNGSMVVRKDWKILTVDISGLPSEFGKPPTSRGDVAVTVADLILACWAGD